MIVEQGEIECPPIAHPQQGNASGVAWQFEGAAAAPPRSGENRRAGGQDRARSRSSWNCLWIWLAGFWLLKKGLSHEPNFFAL